MAEILLLRHGKTHGNTLGRYIGSRTDEPLCEEGIAFLRAQTYPRVDRVYVSPMRRCVETAELIWPEHAGAMRRVPELRECDFGDFENKNYRELSGDPAYQAWIDSGGTLPFPHGESREAFRERCVRAFAGIAEELKSLQGGRLRAALVVHGGTIMSVLEEYGEPKRGYFDYQVKNGCGYLLTPAEGTKKWNCRSVP